MDPALVGLCGVRLGCRACGQTTGRLTFTAAIAMTWWTAHLDPHVLEAKYA